MKTDHAYGMREDEPIIAPIDLDRRKEEEQRIKMSWVNTHCHPLIRSFYFMRLIDLIKEFYSINYYQLNLMMKSIMKNNEQSHINL